MSTSNIITPKHLFHQSLGWGSFLHVGSIKAKGDFDSPKSDRFYMYNSACRRGASVHLNKWERNARLRPVLLSSRVIFSRVIYEPFFRPPKCTSAIAHFFFVSFRRRADREKRASRCWALVAIFYSWSTLHAVEEYQKRE